MKLNLMSFVYIYNVMNTKAIHVHYGKKKENVEKYKRNEKLTENEC